ncbi:hypothetical protein H4R35_006166 [Dimargaris xerosporica]|nr:hypothetical protein H4R35_006166 [Dimargaris xerosporica]
MSSLLNQHAEFKRRLAAQPMLKRHIVHHPTPSQPLAKKPKGESFFKDQRGRISTAAALWQVFGTRLTRRLAVAAWISA